LPTAALWLIFAALVEAPWPRFVLSAVATLLVTAAAIWAADREARRRQLDDPGPIVIDEVAGQLLGLLVALPLVGPVTGRPLVMCTILAFLLFRIFDVAKPWPIRRLERLPGGLGIVADDLAAGLITGIALGIGWTALS
jgi:phosphatidylglycerophosphatase A